MDSIEERYTILKTITCVTLTLSLVFCFGSLLIKENKKISFMNSPQ